MYKHALKKLPKSTVEITVSVPWDAIQKQYSSSFDDLQKELTVEGFRKGKAPKAIAEKHLKREDIYQDVIRKLLPAIYDEIVKKESLKPIISPKVDLVKAKENEEWEFTITVAEKPVIDLGEYKMKVHDAVLEVKKSDIWIPGKNKETDPKTEEAKKQQAINAALTALMKEVKCEISELILEEELNHRLTRLVDDIQRMGLTVDSYLKTKGLTMEQLRERYAKEIEDTYSLEFILSEIAEKENIVVDDKELQKLFEGIKDEKERKSAEANSYFYASLLRKQKTLDYLANV